MNKTELTETLAKKFELAVSKAIKFSAGKTLKEAVNKK